MGLVRYSERAAFLFLVGAASLSSTTPALAESASPPIPQIRYDFDPVAAGEEDEFVAAFGGEVRERYEYTRNPNFGADPQDPRGVWLQRLALHGDLHWPDRWRVFMELHSALEWGREDGPSPVDQDELTVQNAFVEVNLAPSDRRQMLLRLGRQELQLGSARLVSIRDGPNVRRTFDGARVLVRSAAWTFSALAAWPRKDEPGVFDDSTDDTRTLWGVYATRQFEPGSDTGFDLYYLGYANDAGTYDQGTGSERRHTIGVRLFGSHVGWDWNFEPMLQFGRFGSADLRAWTFASETGYTWLAPRWRPRLALSANIASGDRDRENPDLETFSPLFPRGNYFAEDSILGPQNFYNAHLFLTIHPSPVWSLTADYNAFWRLETQDGIYSPSGALVRSGSGSDARFVATALSMNSEWSIGRNWTFTAIYTHSSPRKFLRDTGPSETVRFLELTARFRF